MTDEELTKQLRDLSAGPSDEMQRIGNKAADCIEQLVIQARFLDDLNSVAVTAKDQAEAKLAKAVKLIGYAIELGRFELNPKLLDDLIHFKTEIELEKTE